MFYIHAVQEYLIYELDQKMHTGKISLYHIINHLYVPVEGTLGLKHVCN
jgi:hypothetical protein